MALQEHDFLSTRKFSGDDESQTADFLFRDKSLFDNDSAEYSRFFKGEEYTHAPPEGVTVERKSDDAPYTQDAMGWVEQEEDASGAFAIAIGMSNFADNAGEYYSDESKDRIRLLSKKYVSDKLILSKEDNARLEILNHLMDHQYPRYSKTDWELLEEARLLIDELHGSTGTMVKDS